jgi:phage-related protein
MQEQSESMSDLAESFSGAMTAVVAGLAVASAGLLSQVPVIGEAMSGLGAIVDALAFKMDGVLRPVLGPISDFFFDVADAIFEADGAMGAFIGTAATIATILLSVVGPAILLASKLGLVSVSMGSVASVAGTVVGAIGTVVGAIASLPVVLAAAVAAVAAFVVAYLTNWNGVRDKTNAILGDIFNTIQNVFNNVAQTVGETFDSLVASARDWGESLMERFISGIQSLIGNLRGLIGNVQLAAGVSVSDITGAAGGAISGGASAASEGASDFIGSVSGGATKVFLDGAEVDNQQGRFRKDSLTRRGG